MRALFPGYFNREPEEFASIWKECIFSFDANFLLDFYRSTPALQKTLFGVLGTINDRSWLTHQAALEYYRNREAVIRESSDSYDKVSGLVKDAAKNIENGLKQYQKHTAIEVEKITEIVKKASADVEKLLQELRNKHPDHTKKDEIEEKLSKLFDGKVGVPYSQDALQNVFQKRLLIAHATVVVSGTKISAEIGTSRSEVWRLVQQLRDLGVDIAGHPSTGYSLKSMPDLLLPDMLAPRLSGTLFGKHIHHYYKIGSTNTVAMEAASAGAPEGSVFLAEQQTAGRGRGANQWHSARSSGIYCSVLLRPALPPSDVLILSLAAGLAVHSAVQEIDSRVMPDLKWPNDVLTGGKKFCGILTEMNAEVTRVRYVVVGIGINVNQSSFPADLQTVATSLRLATGTEWSRVELCTALLKALDLEYRNLAENPDAAASILRRFQERSSSIQGQQVEVEENGGVEGVTEGLDPRGFLQVRTPQGVRTVLSGTVRLR